jgi:hypothetical protein
MGDPEEYLELRFAGDVRPADFRAKDVADALKGFEELVIETLREAEDVESIDLDDVVVGLVGVEEGSSRLQFRTSFMSVALSALAFVGSAVSEQAYQDLNDSQRKSLRKIQRVSKKYNSSAELRKSEDGREEVLGMIGPDDEIPEAQTTKGITTLRGTVERVGGKTKSTVHVRLSESQKVIVEVDADTARKLATDLYDEIGLRGEATWFVDTGEIDSFDLIEVVESSRRSASEGLERLADLAGDSFDGVDPSEYINKVRGRTEPQPDNGNQ